MFILLLLPLLCFVHSETYNGNVLELTDLTFPDAIEKHEYLFLKIYVTWCPHCQALAPEWILAADALKEMGINVVLAEIDGGANIQTSLKQGIRGYPTLDFFHSGKSTRYRGPRRANSIVTFVLNETKSH